MIPYCREVSTTTRTLRLSKGACCTRQCRARAAQNILGHKITHSWINTCKRNSWPWERWDGRLQKHTHVINLPNRRFPASQRSPAHASSDQIENSYAGTGSHDLKRRSPTPKQLPIEELQCRSRKFNGNILAKRRCSAWKSNWSDLWYRRQWPSAKIHTSLWSTVFPSGSQLAHTTH